MLPDSKHVVLTEGLTMTSAGTVMGTLDTYGFDYAKINVDAGTGAAASTAVTTLRMCESDSTSALTAYTDGDAVTQFVGAAATSTSAGFVLPALSSTKQNTYTFNVDCRNRKRYIGINFAPELQTVGVGITAELYRVADGTDIKTVATGSDGARVIQSG
jgi:hypothetical protein